MKLVIFLSGSKETKNLFSNAIKKKWWVWNINSRNFLGSLTRHLGWDGKRTTKYYEFIEKFLELANQYWDFENKYICRLIAKFLRSGNPNFLVIHGASKDVEKALLNEIGGFSVNTDDIALSTEDYENQVEALVKNLYQGE